MFGKLRSVSRVPRLVVCVSVPKSSREIPCSKSRQTLRPCPRFPCVKQRLRCVPVRQKASKSVPKLLRSQLRQSRRRMPGSLLAMQRPLCCVSCAQRQSQLSSLRHASRSNSPNQGSCTTAHLALHGMLVPRNWRRITVSQRTAGALSVDPKSPPECRFSKSRVVTQERSAYLPFQSSSLLVRPAVHLRNAHHNR